jgi:hypothetical protein
MSGDVRATRLSASGVVSDARGRVVGMSWVGGTGAGTVVIKDGGAGGPTKLTVDTPAGVSTTESMEVPGRGVLCPTSIYAVLTGVGFVTIFYEG